MFKPFSPPAQWVILLLLTVAITAPIYAIAFPGALLIGPMASGIIAALNGANINVHVRVYQCAQAMIGCMIAATLTPEIFNMFSFEWQIFLGVILSSLVMSCIIGWTICRWQIMPGTSGIWGMTPGAASAMVVMASIYGADVRLVAFMQYLRVICVALATSLAAHFFSDTEAHSLAFASAWFVLPDGVHFAETLLLIAIGASMGWLLKIPSGVMLLPLTLGAALNMLGIITIEMPMWLRAIAFATIGWVIGLRFTKRVLLYVIRAIPKILLSIFVLMLFCAGLAVFVSRTLNVDLLTAFLATSPGGADVMLVIAASTHVDLEFVMGLQIARLIIVLILAPPLARQIAKRFQKSR
ncbi:MAG: AbrB family transcriptional regulator [Burkholderiales bacterium]|jgi:membrane AbrB-like protein|nr:AbrB family transcriptional regulator [Burkholderiales bacterium]